MKICETREFPGGMGGGHLRVRVVEMSKLPDPPKEGDPDYGVTRFRAASDTPVNEKWLLPSEVEKPILPYSDKDSDTAQAVNSGAPVETASPA